MMFGLVFFTACDSSETSETTIVQMSNAASALPTETAEELKDEDKKELTIYYSNGKADGLESETIYVDNITPDIIISNLANHNIVSIDTKVSSFEMEETEGDNRKRITVDMSKTFGEYLKTMGVNGEAVVIAALTDTFLEAYQADCLSLSVGGKTLRTENAVYEKDLTFIDLKPE